MPGHLQIHCAIKCTYLSLNTLELRFCTSTAVVYEKKSRGNSNILHPHWIWVLLWVHISKGKNGTRNYLKYARGMQYHTAFEVSDNLFINWSYCWLPILLYHMTVDALCCGCIESRHPNTFCTQYYPSYSLKYKMQCKKPISFNFKRFLQSKNHFAIIFRQRLYPEEE